MRMDEVFHKLADDHERQRSALLFHGAVYRIGNLFEVRARIARLHHDDARRGEHVVVDGYARRIHRAFHFALVDVALTCVDVRCGALPRDVRIVGRGVAGIDKGVKIVGHGVHPVERRGTE